MTIVTVNSQVDTSSFALGQLTSVSARSSNGTSLPPTTLEYFGPGDGAFNGFPKAVHGPLPGSVGGNATVGASITYDTLGNIATQTVPGSSGTRTVTYHYTGGFGNYYKQEALGEPTEVTVTGTSPDGTTSTTTRYIYDDLHNVSDAIDTAGLDTSFVHNVAHQVLQVFYGYDPQGSLIHRYDPRGRASDTALLVRSGPLESTMGHGQRVLSQETRRSSPATAGVTLLARQREHHKHLPPGGWQTTLNQVRRAIDQRIHSYFALHPQEYHHESGILFQNASSYFNFSSPALPRPPATGPRALTHTPSHPYTAPPSHPYKTLAHHNVRLHTGVGAASLPHYVY